MIEGLSCFFHLSFLLISHTEYVKNWMSVKLFSNTEVCVITRLQSLQAKFQ